MSPLCTIAVTIVALVLPCVDLFEAWAGAGDVPGITRPHSHQVAAAEVDVEAGADDVDEHPHDRGWQAGGAALTNDLESTRCGYLHLSPGSVVRGRRPTASGIRGPPGQR